MGPTGRPKTGTINITDCSLYYACYAITIVFQVSRLWTKMFSYNTRLEWMHDGRPLMHDLPEAECMNEIVL